MNNIDWEEVHGGIKYYCVLNGQSFGPVTFRQFANMLQFEIVSAETLTWADGMTDWQPAKNIDQLCLLFGTIPTVFPTPYVPAPAPQKVETVKEAEAVQTEKIVKTAPRAEQKDTAATDLSALCAEITGRTYIDTLHLNRSWILPKFVEMGTYNHKKSFEYNYKTKLKTLDYTKAWNTLVRNFKALAEMNDKTSATYKIRAGWWNKQVAVAMAKVDLELLKDYVNGYANERDNSFAGNYVIIPKMRGVKCGKHYKENYYYCEEPQKTPFHGWGKKNCKERNLPALYKQIELLTQQIQRAENDKELYNAVKQYNDKRVTSSHFFETIDIDYPNEFSNAYTGDGAYSSMMTIVKHLNLQYKDDEGNKMTRDACVMEIAQRAIDTDFDGNEMLNFFVEKYIDSGIFDADNYRN